MYPEPRDLTDADRELLFHSIRETRTAPHEFARGTAVIERMCSLPAIRSHNRARLRGYIRTLRAEGTDPASNSQVQRCLNERRGLMPSRLEPLDPQMIPFNAALSMIEDLNGSMGREAAEAVVVFCVRCYDDNPLPNPAMPPCLQLSFDGLSEKDAAKLSMINGSHRYRAPRFIQRLRWAWNRIDSWDMETPKSQPGTRESSALPTSAQPQAWTQEIGRGKLISMHDPARDQAEFVKALEKCKAASPEILRAGNRYIEETFSEALLRAQGEDLARKELPDQQQYVRKQWVDPCSNPQHRTGRIWLWLNGIESALTREEACAVIAVVRSMGLDSAAEVAALPSPLLEAPFDRGSDYFSNDGPAVIARAARFAWHRVESGADGVRDQYQADTTRLNDTQRAVVNVLRSNKRAGKGTPLKDLMSAASRSEWAIYRAITALNRLGWEVVNEGNASGYFLIREPQPQNDARSTLGT
jgi:hypothetical protein